MNVGQGKVRKICFRLGLGTLILYFSIQWLNLINYCTLEKVLRMTLKGVYFWQYFLKQIDWLDPRSGPI